MANRKEPKDDKLIRELYEKLDWFTFEATEEEFDPEQVNAIVNLLDALDPQEEAYIRQPSGDGDSEGEDKLVPASDPQAAFERFKKKYHITEEDLLKKNGKAVPEKATGEKIVPFPAGFSEELTPNSADARELTKEAAEEGDGLSSTAGQNGQNVNETLTPNTDAPAPAPDKADRKHRRRFLSTVWGKIAVALLVVVVMGTVLTVGTSAVHQKSFFETVQSGVNSVRIIVTGNEMESESDPSPIETTDDSKIYFNSWDEIAEENSDIKIPEYIPDGMKLTELFKWDNGNYVLYKGTYSAENSQDYLIIAIEYYQNEYANLEMIDDENWSLIDVDEKRQINYYQVENNYIALHKLGKSIYWIEYSDLEELNKILEQLK